MNNLNVRKKFVALALAVVMVLSFTGCDAVVYNDSIEEISQLCDFVVEELGPEVPLHFSRAFPYYKLNDITPTNPEILFKAKEIAIKKGIENVHLGNI